MNLAGDLRGDCAGAGDTRLSAADETEAGAETECEGEREEGERDGDEESTWRGEGELARAAGRFGLALTAFGLREIEAGVRAGLAGFAGLAFARVVGLEMETAGCFVLSGLGAAETGVRVLGEESCLCEGERGREVETGRGVGVAAF